MCFGLSLTGNDIDIIPQYLPIFLKRIDPAAIAAADSPITSAPPDLSAPT